jgi:hypothetical protein
VIAAHGVIDVTAVDMTNTKAGGGSDTWVETSGVKVVVATVGEGGVREAETRVDRDGVRVSPCMPALETEQSSAMRWRVASVEELCSRALIECVQEGGTRTPDLPGDNVSRN